MSLRMKRKISHVCLIVDSSDIPSVSLALNAGIRWIQYREKRLTKRDIFFNSSKLRELTAKFDSCLIINDYVDIALAVDADGVHLGQDDLPLKEAKEIMGDKIIGISTHNLKEALEAEKGGADYIGFGSIFHTNTKSDAVVRGLDLLKEIVSSVSIEVIAIGGINAYNVDSVFKTGCYGVAASSGILKGNIEENISRFFSALKPTMGR